MSQVQEISIQLDGISNTLKTKKFRVPPYQRSYAWEIEHVEALIADIDDAIKSKEREYFLGSIVTTGPSGRRFEVVDGQQRLTTVSLLISAIKDRFKSEGDSEAETSIRNDFLASVDRKTKEREPRLSLNEVDDELYQELINDKEAIDPKKYPRQSHKRLLQAAKYLEVFIDKLCQDAHDSEETLHEWLDYLETNLKVILVQAPDDSNAFVIFETLNDRGLELAISDLLKNYLFHRSADKISEAKERWLAMVATLESASDDPLVVSYLRHFAMSKYGLVREKELFGLIKRKITSKKLAIQFSTDLSNSSKTYAALLNADHEIWRKFHQDTKDSVSAFNILGMVQVRPLLLAILEKFEIKKVGPAFKKLVALSVRFQIVGGAGGGTLERIYSEAAKSVSEGKLNSISDILRGFSNLPSDAVFEQAFSIATTSKPALARYYLRTLESGMPGATGELIPNSDVTKVNLEHVLPLSPNSDWERRWNSEDIRAYQRRLGNLAIMSSNANSISGNDAFEEKKASFKSSPFSLTKIIADKKAWDAEAIDDRQRVMAKVAVTVWSLK
ncbi:DUF262 domain-containing HNH endonuclease family protein [Pseudomonas cerasi]|uniref:DUF262 domain-containing protein n=1 Tax=Pseudomonas cerasi TaxID=1583341 RepID=UPI0023007D23|nr:DUF262 domain-containing HNH endonuclease family protein [Pseudomonas cerasi]MDA7013584.1 DUF262 domain-containing HNH endonuclease family protein [Pseudomonas cerasi]